MTVEDTANTWRDRCPALIIPLILNHMLFYYPQFDILFLLSEPGVLGAIKAGPYGKLYNPNNFVNAQNGGNPLLFLSSLQIVFV